MIVQVRGASGSGKSRLVREFVEQYGPVRKYMMSEAADWGLAHIDCPPSRPFALSLPGLRVVVPGHYEASGGGADMIKKVSDIYDVVEKAVAECTDVLVESLFMSKDLKAVRERSPLWPTTLKVIYLDLPEAECEEAVQQRREATGRERRPLRQHANDWKEVRKACEWLEQNGYDVERHSRQTAAARIRELLV